MTKFGLTGHTNTPATSNQTHRTTITISGIRLVSVSGSPVNTVAEREDNLMLSLKFTSKRLKKRCTATL